MTKSSTPEYRCWSDMRQRCNNPNAKAFKDYGARGIRVCDAWSSFDAFYADMGPRPSDLHSIDRIDVDGNYEPGNCRWADQKTQARNTRRSSAEDSGVRYNERDKCWELFIRADNKTVRVGSYGSKAEAVEARGMAVLEYWVDGKPAPASGDVQRNNTSGYRGVSWSKYHSKWDCYVYVNRKRKLIGRFATLDEAIKARAHHGITSTSTSTKEQQR